MMKKLKIDFKISGTMIAIPNEGSLPD